MIEKDHSKSLSKTDIRIAIAVLITIVFWILTYIPYLVQGSYVSIFLQLLWIPALIFPIVSFIYFLVRWFKKNMSLRAPHIYLALLSLSTYLLALGEKIF
jgi:hypothetical protein